MEKYTLIFFDGAKDDYKNLDGSQRIQVDKAIQKIKENGMQIGEELTGNLAGCRKIKQKRLGLRIVFRQSADSIEIIEIVAIGKRDKKKVYTDSFSRIADTLISIKKK